MEWDEVECIDKTDIFYSELPEDVAVAKAICSECELRHACLSLALERGEAWGVWGGETPDERGVGKTRHGEPAGFMWHKRQLKRDPNHVTCVDCIRAYREWLDEKNTERRDERRAVTTGRNRRRLAHIKASEE
jgi:hypothetical protein